MKYILFTALLTVLAIQSNAQNTNQMEKEKVESVLLQYIQAVDAGDENSAAGFLAPEFRVVLTKFPNATALKILDKEQYLCLIKEGKAGGKKRKAALLLTDIHKDAAFIKIKLESEELLFTNYYSLLKINNNWVIVNDIPQVEKKN